VELKRRIAKFFMREPRDGEVVLGHLIEAACA
jgi:hypothetical protein